MNSNLHFLTKHFRKTAVIIATILLCFYCNIEAEKQSKYYNLTGALQHLTDVQILDLQVREGENSNNQLKTLPKEIENLQKLQYLYLNNNRLTTLPKEIGNLQKLQKLYLNNNQLTTLPKEIGKLKKLNVLNLGGNPSLMNQKQKIQKLLPNVTITFDSENK
ncbi:leucine-rich repeat domain-containing protein [Leptospira noguchii]|uniref:leucine-rich repeat domain-containing protein n=1 Tax=Leptospira noguchii TaxID=28182 RepID=UPI000328740F|nr:leucine-rich repeat domain-containing protein [Leptospira noguchii]EMS85865.1 leucine rich repeat protein [Leptospira noguchii str. Cascata]